MIFKYASNTKIVMFNILALIVCSESVVLAFIVQTLTNIAQEKNLKDLPLVLLFVISISLVLLISNLLLNRLKAKMIYETNVILREKILKGMFNESKVDTDNNLGFLTNDFKLLEENRFQSQLGNIVAFYTLLLAICYSLYSSVILTIIFFIGSAVPLFASSFFQKPIQKSAKEWSNANGGYVNKTKSYLHGIATIKLYQSQNEALINNQPTIKKLENKLKKMSILDENGNSYVSTIANLSTFLIPFSIGIYLVINNQVSLGLLFGMVQLSNAFIQPILAILNNRNKISTTKDINEKVIQYVEISDNQINHNPTSFSQEIKYQGISIARNSQKLINNLELEIKKHAKIAIIGKSGSGKSTLLKYLDGENRSLGSTQETLLDNNNVDIEDVNDLYAYASQSPVIFAGDLLFNLTLGKNVK